MFTLNVLPKPRPVLGCPHTDLALPRVSGLEHLLFNQPLYLYTKKKTINDVHDANIFSKQPLMLVMTVPMVP